MRLIDADALQRKICGAKCGCEYEDCGNEGDCEFAHFIFWAPTVEAKPVRHGKWIVWNGMDIPENHGRHKCSECGEFAIKPKYGEEILTKRCLNCGARMESE